MKIRLQTPRFAAVVGFASFLLPMTAGEQCCSWSLKDCNGGGTYCKQSASNCENCLLHWIDTAQNDATCTSRLEGGCNSHEDCCGDGKMACIELVDQDGVVYMGCDIPTCCANAAMEDCIPDVEDYSAFCNYAEANCADEERCPGGSWVDRNQTCCSWDLKTCNAPNTFCDVSKTNCEDSCLMHWIYSDLTMTNGCTARMSSCGGHDECCGGGKMGCFERPDPQNPGSNWTACDLRECCSTDGVACMFEENSSYCNYSPANCQDQAACAGTWLERPIPTCPATGTPVATPTSTCVIDTEAPTIICESGTCDSMPTKIPTHMPTEAPTETPMDPTTTRVDLDPQAILQPALDVAEVENCYNTDPITNFEQFTARNWYDNVNLPSYLNRGAFNSMVDDNDTMIGGALYTFSNGTLKIGILFPPLYPEESREVRLVLKKMDDTVVVDTLGEISINIWHCLFRVEYLPEDEYVYEVIYAPNPADASNVFFYSGTVTKPVANPRIVVVSCLGYDNTMDKTNIINEVLAIGPDIILYNGDQTYVHNNLGYGFFEAVYSLNEITRNAPTMTQMDDHDYGQGNVWGAGSDANEESGAGFIRPACLVNILQHQVLSHLPDPVSSETLANGITIHYTNYVYGRLDFAILEARKFKSDRDSVIQGGSMLGEDQEAWLQNWCNNDQDKVKVVLAQTPFATLRTHITAYQQGGVVANTVNPDPNGSPVAPRNEAMAIMTGCTPLIISGDQHLGIVVSYDSNGPYDCAAPAAINSIFWRLNTNNVGETHVDPWGNQYFLHAVWNIPMEFIDQYSLPKNTRELPNAEKQTRADGILTVYIDDDKAYCVAQSYRTAPTVQYNVSVPLFTQV